MKSFKNILVVVDSTRTEHHELERAMKLAEHGGVKLHLVDIVKDANLTVRLLSRDYLHIHELLVKEKREQLQVLVDHCKSHGIEADGEVLEGVSSQLTLLAAQRIGADLIVRATKGRAVVKPETWEPPLRNSSNDSCAPCGWRIRTTSPSATQLSLPSMPRQATKLTND
ncbi:MAG: universal stress protein [Pirellulaceae bacterium]